MAKSNARKPFDLSASLYRLKCNSWKIRGVSYLLENFRNEAGPPLDESTAWQGISLILLDCSRTIDSQSRRIEEDCLSRTPRLRL